MIVEIEEKELSRNISNYKEILDKQNKLYDMGIVLQEDVIDPVFWLIESYWNLVLKEQEIELMEDMIADNKTTEEIVKEILSNRS